MEEAGVKNLNGVKAEPRSADLVDYPLSPLENVGTGIGMAVVDIRAHCTYKLLGRHTEQRAHEKRTQVIIVGVFLVNALGPVLPFAVNAVNGSFTCVSTMRA